MDFSKLNFSIKDIKGDSRELIAKLTPLGWTFIRNNNNSYECTQYGRFYFFTFFANKTEAFDQKVEKNIDRVNKWSNKVKK